MMKLYAPKYIKDFKCIADKCEHSCCIGWEIDVDDTALNKYKSLKGGFADEILKSISFKGTPHFKLCADDRCPHLDENGLCKIILTAGEDFLCDICREHPRFYNYTSVAEQGIGASCIEAARVILKSDCFDEFVEIGTTDGKVENTCFDGRFARKKAFEILKNKSLSFEERLNAIMREYDVEPTPDEVYLEILDSLEYLNPVHKALFGCYSSNLAFDCGEYPSRAMAYFIYRHCTEACDEDDFKLRLAFCIFCTLLLCSLVANEHAKTLDEVANLFSIISEEIEYSEDNTEKLIY